jgi:hypothetical protein
MKRLTNYEIESVVNVVCGKISEKRRVKWEKEYDSINELVKDEIEKINRSIEKFTELRNTLYENNKKEGLYFNMGGIGNIYLGNDFIKRNNDLVNHNERNKIRDRIVINNIKGLDIEKFIEDLVSEF